MDIVRVAMYMLLYIGIAVVGAMMLTVVRNDYRNQNIEIALKRQRLKLLDVLRVFIILACALGIILSLFGFSFFGSLGAAVIVSGILSTLAWFTYP